MDSMGHKQYRLLKEQEWKNRKQTGAPERSPTRHPPGAGVLLGRPKGRGYLSEHVGHGEHHHRNPPRTESGRCTVQEGPGDNRRNVHSQAEDKPPTVEEESSKKNLSIYKLFLHFFQISFVLHIP